jgi:lysine 2,3-aminomutase
MKTSAQEENISDCTEEPPGKLIVKISSHLRKLSETSPEIKRQFFPSEEENHVSDKALLDPLIEEHYLKTKGLYHKYDNRVLILLTLACASYCRFCTRKRRISELLEARLNNIDIENIIAYLKKHPEINETVFSGGDPFMSPKNLIYALEKIAKLPQIKIIRIHTRVPISAPSLVKKEVINYLAKITEKAVYVSLHFERPEEITPPTIKIIKDLRKAGVTLLSQSVFLKGVNDKYEVLAELFTKLSELGIRPYYIFHCDPVVGSEHFIVPLEKEVEIMTELRKNLSGIAYPFFVIDTPNGSGKVPVPLNFWKFDNKSFTDFEDKKITVID